MIKAQSLEATLPAIIFIHNVYVSLLKQDTTKKRRVYEMYKMYEIAKAYNVIIKGLADHGLHVTYQLHFFVLKSYMPWPHLRRHRYKLSFVTLL